MTTAADLQSAADLCTNAAQAAVQQQTVLGPCPLGDAALAAAWTQKNSQLQHNVTTLTNLSASLAAQAVTDGLNAIWPNLQGLDAVTASAQADIATIANVGAALTELAAVISFGVAVAALVAAPSPTGVANAVTAFNALKAALPSKTQAAAKSSAGS